MAQGCWRLRGLCGFCLQILHNPPRKTIQGHNSGLNMYLLSRKMRRFILSHQRKTKIAVIWFFYNLDINFAVALLPEFLFIGQISFQNFLMSFDHIHKCLLMHNFQSTFLTVVLPLWMVDVTEPDVSSMHYPTQTNAMHHFFCLVYFRSPTTSSNQTTIENCRTVYYLSCCHVDIKEHFIRSVKKGLRACM